MFDQDPAPSLHGECAEEIETLNALLHAARVELAAWKRHEVQPRYYAAVQYDAVMLRAEAAEKELDIQRAEISILKRGIAAGEAKLAEAQYEAERQLRNALMADEKLTENGEGRG